MTAAAPQHTLVIADDGTDPSDVAWDWVNAHRWPGWAVDVLTARFDESAIDWGSPPRVEQWRPEWPRRFGEGISQEHSRFLVVWTDPRAMLAERADADLMVVGIRRRSPVEAVWIGSTTEWLLHHPPAPLAVIRDAGPARRVLVCSDGSEHALAASTAFARLPFAGEAEVDLLVVDDGRVDVGQAVEKTAASLAGQGIGAKPSTAEGQPTSTILEHLEREAPDLVVMGTRGLTGWKRLRVGSTAAAVVRASDRSCLVSSTDAAEAAAEMER